MLIVTTNDLPGRGDREGGSNRLSRQAVPVSDGAKHTARQLGYGGTD